MYPISLQMVVCTLLFMYIYLWYNAFMQRDNGNVWLQQISNTNSFCMQMFDCRSNDLPQPYSLSRPVLCAHSSVSLSELSTRCV